MPVIGNGLLTPIDVEVIGPLEALNVRAVLNNAENVVSSYEENPSMANSGLVATQPLIYVLQAMVVLVATFGGFAMTAAQSVRGEDHNNSGKTASDLQITAAFANVFSVFDYFASALKMGRYEDIYIWAIKYLISVLSLVDVLECLNGFGAPERGDKFDSDSRKFSVEIYELLNGAMPSPDGWVGVASAVYADQNEHQQARVKNDFAKADSDIARMISEQAEQVELLRQELAGLRISLSGWIFILSGQLAAISLDMFGLDLDICLQCAGYAVVGALLAAVVQILITVEKACFDFVPGIKNATRIYRSIDHDATAKKLSPRQIEMCTACL